MIIVVVYNNGSTSLVSTVKEQQVQNLIVSESLSKSVDKTNHPVQLKDKKKYKVKQQKKFN